jgi:hypothetical protein
LAASVEPEDASSGTRHEWLRMPRVIDLDGDGRPEILVEAILQDGRSTMALFRLSPLP